MMRMRYKKAGFIAVLYLLKIQVVFGISDRSLNDVVGGPLSYDRIVDRLIKENLYFTAIPFMKEILSGRQQIRNSNRFEGNIEKLIAEVGVRQFETLPDSILSRVGAPIIYYIRAKKYFRRGQYRKALQALRSNFGDSSIGPFVSMLRGSIYSITGQSKKAIWAFEECSEGSLGFMTEKGIRWKQYQITKDYCLIGKARALFELRRYEEASSTYLDLDKSSPVWPEILFEEAWTSFYQKNYNRTLGKIVSYKAPVFQNFFIPEFSILEALSYMELCLWSDAKKSIDAFYKEYIRSARQLGRFLKQKGNDYRYFYKAARARKKRRVPGGMLYNRLLRSVIFSPGYQELNQTLLRGNRELSLIRGSRSAKAKRILLPGLKDTLNLQKRLLGSYVRKELLVKYSLLRKAFTQMSYIKLEILKRKKSDLYYQIKNKTRERGDIRYLRRNEKQYFWDFNGEFWADELGDYVFALPSKCVVK
ncbi:MAG: hypothetical protein OXB88_06910 [Bacteriovoracales bacterium]|nr:hypothetical protein [Bacteriovoracales bacterium]